MMDNPSSFDLIVVGGGILGAFHAYHALHQGLRVALLEKDPRPQGATTRNFGQVVPSGMDTKWQNFGRRSLEIYQDLQTQIDLSFRQQGSIYFASDEEEWTLLQELAQINQQNDYPSELRTAEECLLQYPGLRSDYVQGGLFFPQEMNVNPRVAIHRLLAFLEEQKNLSYFPATPVVAVDRSGDHCLVTDSRQNHYQAEKVIICNGSDFQFLFPNIFRQSDLSLVKLQMFSTVPQARLRIPSSILTGLTIRRYEAFRECPSYQAIKAKGPKSAFAEKWGIHILFKQEADGRVILGDSHEYAQVDQGETLSFDTHDEVNRYILQAAQEIFTLEDWTIQQTWTGCYSQCRNQDIFLHDIDEHIHIVTGIGGKGMTGSAGFSEKNIARIFNLVQH